MKKLITLILTWIGQVLMAFAVFGYLCAMIIQETSAKVHGNVTLTCWRWKTRLKWFFRKLGRYETKAWKFIKSLRWAWIFAAYMLTILINIIYKDWLYIDYIWIAPFLMLMAMISYEVFHSEDEDKTTPDFKLKHEEE